jgi:hypothetical protein
MWLRIGYPHQQLESFPLMRDFDESADMTCKTIATLDRQVMTVDSSLSPLGSYVADAKSLAFAHRLAEIKIARAVVPACTVANAVRSGL